jgi:hypothetical protein
MSNRQQFIRPAVKADPAAVASCLRKVATALDAADDESDTVFYTGDQHTQSVSYLAHAWAQTALLIADKADVDSVTLRALAAVIDNGGQRVLPGF